MMNRTFILMVGVPEPTALGKFRHVWFIIIIQRGRELDSRPR